MKKHKKERKRKFNKYMVNSICKPKTTSQIIRIFFKDYDETSGIIQLDDKTFSVAFEYEDVSFAKANYEEQESIFLKWVEFLHSFNYNDHLQIVHSSIPVKTEDYKKKYIYAEEGINGNELRIAQEMNLLIESALTSDIETTLCESRKVIITIKAENFKQAQDTFMDYQLKTEQKFKEINSKIRRMSIQERLEELYNVWNRELEKIDILKELKENKDLSIYDIIAPKENVSMRETNLININEKKYIRVLYVSKLPDTVTPRFYNRVTTLENSNIIVTMNITPTNSAQVIKGINKIISGMKTERLEKVKKANRSNYSYEIVKDEKLEGSLKNVQQLKDALEHKKQKLFKTNLLIAIQANSIEELEKITNKVKGIAGEYSIEMNNLDWQQLEGIQNTVGMGWNTLQFQRSLTSEACAANIPFNTKDLLHEESIFYGLNMVSKNPIFADRKRLINGNGCVLAMSGARKIICGQDYNRAGFIKISKR